MKRLVSALFAISLAVFSPMHASENSGNADRELVYALFEAQNLPDQLRDITDGLINSQIMDSPELFQYRLEITSFFQKCTSYNALKSDLADVYLKHFTADEIRQITAFYRSPVGKKMAAAAPDVLKEMGALAQQRITGNLPELKKMLENRTSAIKSSVQVN